MNARLIAVVTFSVLALFGFALLLPGGGGRGGPKTESGSVEASPSTGLPLDQLASLALDASSRFEQGLPHSACAIATTGAAAATALDGVLDIDGDTPVALLVVRGSFSSTPGPGRHYPELLVPVDLQTLDNTITSVTDDGTAVTAAVEALGDCTPLQLVVARA